jgi:hypothetical protein
MYRFTVVDTVKASQSNYSFHAGQAEFGFDARAKRSLDLAKLLTGSESSATCDAFQQALGEGRAQLAGRLSAEDVRVMLEALGPGLIVRGLVMDLPEVVAQGLAANGSRTSAALSVKLLSLSLKMTAALLDALERVWDEGRPSQTSIEDRCEHVGLQLA